MKYLEKSKKKDKAIGSSLKKKEELMPEIKFKKNEIIHKIEENTDIKQEKEQQGKFETIESIDFKNGENTLTIRFSKKINRTFRIQVFLNSNFEVRPVTYAGYFMGISYWNLLKGSMKK